MTIDIEFLFPLIRLFLFFVISFLIAFAITPILTHFLYKYKLGKNVRDTGLTPVFTKMHAHKAGTPTMGGIIVWGSVAFLALLFYYLQFLLPEVFWTRMNFLSRRETLLPLAALVSAALVGIVDDVMEIKGAGSKQGGFRVRHRLIIYSSIAVLGALWFYFKLGWDLIHVPFMGDYFIGIWYIPIFILIIVATSFSVNEADGLDGLAGGILLTAFAAYGAISFAKGKYDLATLCAVIVGALLAFLWFNINPARFFMGDTGSMSLGVTLGTIAMLTNTILLLPLIGFVLVLESGSVAVQLLSKKITGKKIFLSSPLHHHFEAKGWGEPKIVMRFWIISSVFAILGLVIFLVERSYLGYI